MVKTIEDKRTRSGIEIQVPESYKGLEERMLATLYDRLAPYPKAKKTAELILADKEVNGSWDMSDYMAVEKLGYNDHGDTHAIITAAFASQIVGLLLDSGYTLDAAEPPGDRGDSMLVTVAGALLHDIGNQVHRRNHPLFGAVLAAPILGRLLSQVYGDAERAAEIRGMILHAIYSHEAGTPSLTDEASAVAIADGCDMFKGRGRMPFDAGNVNIHTVSALSISDIRVERGEEKPVRIVVDMENSAGIFQVEELLAKKVETGTLRDKVEIVATAVPEGGSDRRIVSSISYGGGRFTPL